MKTFLLIQIYIASLFLFCCECYPQRIERNFGFESTRKGGLFDWSVYHRQFNYTVSLDSVFTNSGKYAASIEFTGDTIGFQILESALPYNYIGQKITLSGYIKTRGVIEGFAGLWLMMDPDSTYDNIETCGVKVFGTTDWQKYEVTLDMDPANTKKIVIGGILTGKGKMWFDDLAVYIDGKSLNDVQPYQPKIVSANNDDEFDNGSQIVFPELNEQKIKDLEILGRIWGFLKYHHPAITQGNYNWDYELFRILPDYLNASTLQQRDQILWDWINKYGNIPPCKTCQDTPDGAILKPDLSWIENSNINQELKELLYKIYSNRHQGAQFYVKIVPYFGYPLFTNEKMYERMPSTDPGFQLLSLFRCWNMVYYFFPYKHLTDKNWNSVIKEYIPRFIKADSRLSYELVTALLIGELCDSHAYPLGIWNATETLKGAKQIPARLHFVEEQLVVEEYYGESSELKKGDVITCIEGKPVEEIVDSMCPYYSASNEVTKRRDITNDILRTNNKFIQIGYNSSGELKQKNIPVIDRAQWMEYRFRLDTVPSFRLINNDIGYINLGTIQQKDIPLIKQQFKHTAGIIVDIRNYPPGFVINLLCPYFTNGVTPYLKYTQANINNPGELNYIPYPGLLNQSEDHYLGKLVILVNEETQSRAECMAMAFQAGDNTTVVGSKTAGALGNPTLVILPGIIGTQFTGNMIHYPDGKDTGHIGIIPDVTIKPTIKGIREERDELLEKAIEVIYRKENKLL